MSTEVAVVTGAATGIGAASATALGRRGYFVYLADIDERGRDVAEALGTAHFIRCDVTSESDLEALSDTIAQSHDRVDVLVNNAGGFGVLRALEEVTLSEWNETLSLNLTSVFLVTRALLPLIRKSERGRIINLGSAAGQAAGWETSPPYAAAKAAVHSLSRVMAFELARDGVTVNALAPSAVLTDRIRSLRDDHELEQAARSLPLGRYQTPEEVAEWIVFLASEDSGFMTGQTVSVNGGRFMA